MAQRRIASVPDAVETFRAAVDEDVTAALCALDTVHKSFAAAFDEASHRIAMVEESVAEVERCAPLLRLIEEPPPEGLRVRRAWARAFWPALILLCMLAAAAGFLAARWPLH